MPAISIIVPIYKTERYLEKCLTSIIEQTFTDIEIICIDDSSPDNSCEIVNNYKYLDSRIVYLKHKKNMGPGEARNTGIRHSKAQYIAGVDSDDYIEKNMLQNLWDASENGKYDIIACGFRKIDGDGNILQKRELKNKEKNFAERKNNIFGELNPAFWNKLWRRSLFVDNNIYFPDHDYFEDMSTTPRLLSVSQNLKTISPCLYNYVIRPGSITNAYGGKQLLDYFKGFELLKNYLENNNIYERYSAEYHQYCFNNLKFHIEYIESSNIDDQEKNQYLKHLYLMTKYFFSEFDELKIDQYIESIKYLILPEEITKGA